MSIVIAELKHFFQERMNGILFYMVLFILPAFITHQLIIFIMMKIDLTVNTILIYTFLIYSALFIIELILSLSLDGILSIIGKRYINKITMCKNGVNHRVDGDEYSAVLIGNNLSFIQNVFANEGACGLYLLIKYFENTNKHYIICQKVDKSQFDRFVSDDKCQELYILGHGSKRSFSINNENNGIICYSEYKDVPKKRVIVQLHCANTVIGENNDSLVDLLATDIDNSYVGNGYINVFNEWWYCFKTWRKNRPKKMKR